jgi:hypothetical protein
MDKLIILVIMVLSLSAAMWVQAQVYAQNQSATIIPAVVPVNPEATADAYTALITSIGTLVGTIGSIIGVIAVFIRDTRTKALAQQVGVGMVTFGQKTVENTDRIRNLTRATYQFSPDEVKKFLEDNRLKVEQLAESVNIGNDQLDFIKDNIPGDTTAKIRKLQKDLPTESYETRPGTV